MKLDYIVKGSAAYASEDGTAIDCIAKFDAIPEEVPFTATATDPLPHVVEVWEALEKRRAGKIAPYVPRPVPIPDSVSPIQMRKAIRRAGLREAVDAYLATAPDEIVEAWEYATVILYDDPSIEAARVALGMSDDAKADLFRLAASL